MPRPLLIAGLILAAACDRAAPRTAPLSATPSGACPEAYFAATEEPPACASADGCIRIYQVTTDCTVKLRNTLEGASGWVAWPNARAALVLYDVADPPALRRWIIASPLTERAPAPAWQTITFGVPDPEGMLGWGFVTDEQHAYAIGCAGWDQGEEEWTCDAFEYLRSDGARTDVAPVPAFARRFAAGPIADGVTIDDSLACRSASPGEDELSYRTSFDGEPVATAPRAGDRYFVYRMVAGVRDSADSDLTVTAMKGCAVDPTTTGWLVPGPGGLFAHAAPVPDDQPSRMHVYLGDAPAPLRTADGAPFETRGTIAWAAP